jgi:predicted alpha/beta-fold hydrolase
MPVQELPVYKPPILLRNGHINTLWTYLSRDLGLIHSSRIRYETYDADFVDVDFVKEENDDIVILLHGLEGSSDSQYMQGMSFILNQNGFDVAMLNHRSCSGEINYGLAMYHSGFTKDIDMLVNKLALDYNTVRLVGFSMGGNMALKYIGDGVYDLNAKLKSVVAISVPVDLGASSNKLNHWSNYLYERNFLDTLRKKAIAKQLQFPEQIDKKDIDKITSLVAFDDYFTGPLHGFKDSQDYYNQCNSLQFLPHIKKPALLINALDDPFLTPSCFPYEVAERTPLLNFGTSRYGGHVGFYQKGTSKIFTDDLAIDFLKRN